MTHSFDQNQRINFLAFRRGANRVTVTAPANGNVCPPGHYMFFLFNQNKVPSVAAIIQIAAVTSQPATGLASAIAPFRVLAPKIPSPVEQDAAIQKEEKQPPVVVGVTPTCPYGISACWGGAYEALKNLDGVRLVRPIPNALDSTAYVYLKHEGLPDLDVFPTQFANIANGTHIFRGVEVTVEGVLEIQESGSLIMHGNDKRPPLILEPIEAGDKIQWDATKGSVKPLNPVEQDTLIRSSGRKLRARAAPSAPQLLDRSNPTMDTSWK